MATFKKMKLNLNKHCKYIRDKIETRLKNRSVRNLEFAIPVLGYGTLWPKIELRAGKGEGILPSLRCYKLAFNGARCLD
jgi:hypothetical protein